MLLRDVNDPPSLSRSVAVRFDEPDPWNEPDLRRAAVADNVDVRRLRPIESAEQELEPFFPMQRGHAGATSARA